MSLSINDGIKVLLATLELVKYSYTSRVDEVSEQEVESAKQNLNQLAELVESIRQNLTETIINKDIESIARSSNETQQSIIAPSESSQRTAIQKEVIDGAETETPPEFNNHQSNDLTITMPPSNDSVMEGSETPRAQLSTDDSAKSIEPSHRRLSAPCLMPMNEEGFGVSLCQ